MLTLFIVFRQPRKVVKKPTEQIVIAKKQHYPSIRSLVAEAKSKLAACPDSSPDKPIAMVRLAGVLTAINDFSRAEEYICEAISMLLTKARKDGKLYSELASLVPHLNESNVSFPDREVHSLIADSILMDQDRPNLLASLAALDSSVIDDMRFHALLRVLKECSFEQRKAFLARAVPNLIYGEKVDRAILATFALSNVSQQALGDIVTYLVRSGQVRRAWELASGYGEYRYRGLDLALVRKRFHAALAASNYRFFNREEMKPLLKPSMEMRHLEWMAALYKTSAVSNRYSNTHLTEAKHIVNAYDYWSLPLMAAQIAHNMKRPVERYEFLTMAGKGYVRARKCTFALSQYSCQEHERAFVDTSLSIGSWDWIKVSLVEGAGYRLIDCVEKVTRHLVDNEKIELVERLFTNLNRRSGTRITNACCQVLIEARGAKKGYEYAREKGFADNVLTPVSLARSAVRARFGTLKTKRSIHDLGSLLRKKFSLMWFSKEKPFSHYLERKLESLEKDSKGIWIDLEEAKASVQAGKETDLTFLGAGQSLVGKSRLLFSIEAARLFYLSRQKEKAEEIFFGAHQSIEPESFPLGPYDLAGTELSYLPNRVYEWFGKTKQEWLQRWITNDLVRVGNVAEAVKLAKDASKWTLLAFSVEEPIIIHAAQKGDSKMVRELVSDVLPRFRKHSDFGPSFFRAIAKAVNCCGMSLVAQKKVFSGNSEGKALFLVASALGLMERDESSALACIDEALKLTKSSNELNKYRVQLRAAFVLAKMKKYKGARAILDSLGLGDSSKADSFVHLEELALGNQRGGDIAVPLFLALGDHARARAIARSFRNRLAANMLVVAKNEMKGYLDVSAVEIGMLLPFNELVYLIDSSLENENLRPTLLLLGRLCFQGSNVGNAYATKICQLSLKRKKKLRTFEAMELVKSGRYLRRLSLIDSY